MAKGFQNYYDVTFWIERGEFGQCLRCGHGGSYSDIWGGIKLGGEKFCPACGRRIFFPLEDKSIINCIDVTLKEEEGNTYCE